MWQFAHKSNKTLMTMHTLTYPNSMLSKHNLSQSLNSMLMHRQTCSVHPRLLFCLLASESDMGVTTQSCQCTSLNQKGSILFHTMPTNTSIHTVKNYTDISKKSRFPQ